MNEAIIHRKMLKEFWDRVTAGVFGIGSGMFTFFNRISIDSSYWVSTLKAAVTAGFCAFAALCAKRTFTWMERKWKTRKKRRR